jgi:hypothetical protein
MMPNCDFYALRDDHSEVLKFIIEETDCRIFEKDSAPWAEVRQFHEVEEILYAYDKGLGQFKVLLNLYSPSMEGEFKFRRILLDQKKFGEGAFRYEAHGWGAIQLYLAGVHKERLCSSHTNHNSQTRALHWANAINYLGKPEDWNWDEVTRISSRINRFIRKIAIGKHGSMAVLPAALQWVNTGRPLGN